VSWGAQNQPLRGEAKPAILRTADLSTPMAFEPWLQANWAMANYLQPFRQSHNLNGYNLPPRIIPNSVLVVLCLVGDCRFEISDWGFVLRGLGDFVVEYSGLPRSAKVAKKKLI
jgi:hypothetical protein